MTTLATMKTRIDRELRRNGNIDTQIEEAISSAIQAYRDERFFFNEKRTVTFNTVADQEFYDSDDQVLLNDLVKIDYVKLRIDDTVFDLQGDRPEWMEGVADNATATGQPGWYVYYERQIRLYPIPATSGWQVRVAGLYHYAAPTTDAETGNFWMTEAERLIRCRAKYELATHVLMDMQLAQVMTANTTEAFDQLKKKTNKLTQMDNGRVVPMHF
jgi:hypothetical protein